MFDISFGAARKVAFRAAVANALAGAVMLFVLRLGLPPQGLLARSAFISSHQVGSIPIRLRQKEQYEKSEASLDERARGGRIAAPDMNGRTAAAACCVVFILVGCGTSDVGPGTDRAGPEECGGTADTTVTLDGSQLDRLMGYPQPGGELTLTILERDDPPGTFKDPFTGQTITAQGQFVGYRYSVRNDTNVEIQPATQVNDHLRLTDGTRSWPRW